MKIELRVRLSVIDGYLGDEVVPCTFEVMSGQEAVASFRDGLVCGIGQIGSA